MADSILASSEVLAPTEIYRRVRAAGKTRWKGPLRVYERPCDCPGCAMQYRSVSDQQGNIDYSYEGSITVSETASLSRGFCTSIFEDLQIVQSALHKHGDLVHKRWLKKSNTKRKAYIKQLRPNMYESEHTTLDLQSNKCVDAIPIRKYREIFLLPYMTLETLSKDGPKLLRLLYQRVAHMPEELVTFDDRQLLSGWLAGAFEEKFNAGCITMYGRSYGRWSLFNKTGVHNGDCYGAPRTLLILEAQALLSRFLRDFAISMVSNIDALTVEQTVQKLSLSGCSIAKRLEPKEFSWTQFAMTYYNEPFAPPPLFDERMMNQLMEIVQEKQAETQDHLWLLQTDPTYFYELLSYWKAYNVGTLPGSKMTKDQQANLVEGRVIFNSVTQAQEWNDFATELQYVRDLYIAHKQDIKPGSPLPESYDRALGGLMVVAIRVLIYKTMHMRELTFVCPAWKSLWKVHPKVAGNEDAMIVRRKDGSSVDYHKFYESDHIFFCLAALGERPESIRYYDIANILKSLDLHLRECGKAEAGKIDYITYNRITDMAAAYRILAALRMHRPSISLRYVSETEVFKTRDSLTWRLWRHNDRIAGILDNPRKFRFGTAFHNLDRYRMPSGKKNEQWLGRANSARKALSDVWSTARNNFTNMYRELNISASDINEVTRMLSHHDSPDFLAMVTRENDEILDSIARSALKIKLSRADSSSDRSLIPHLSALKDVPEKAPNTLLEVKPKAKTRPESNLLDSNIPESANSETVRDSKPQPKGSPLPLPKKAKSLDTLRLLFPTAISDLQGTIQWFDFIATMNEMGFQGEHRGGSEWTFRSFSDGPVGETHTTSEGSGQVKKSIVIHQPHPDLKMGAVRLQQIGKRLWRRFGWERQRFQGL